MSNPECPKCGDKMVKAGFQQRSKRQMYKCKDCNYRSTLTNDIGGRPVTAEACISCGDKNIYARKLCSSCYRKLMYQKKKNKAKST